MSWTSVDGRRARREVRAASRPPSRSETRLQSREGPSAGQGSCFPMPPHPVKRRGLHSAPTVFAPPPGDNSARLLRCLSIFNLRCMPLSCHQHSSTSRASIISKETHAGSQMVRSPRPHSPFQHHHHSLHRRPGASQHSGTATGARTFRAESLVQGRCQAHVPHPATHHARCRSSAGQSRPPPVSARRQARPSISSSHTPMRFN